MHIYNINVIVCKINYVAIHACTCTYILNEGVGGVLDLRRFIFGGKNRDLIHVRFLFYFTYMHKLYVNSSLTLVLYISFIFFIQELYN